MEILKIKRWKELQNNKDIQFEVLNTGTSEYPDEGEIIVSVERVKDKEFFQTGFSLYELRFSKTRWVNAYIDVFYPDLKSIRLMIHLFDTEENPDYPQESFTMELEINDIDTDAFAEKLNLEIINNFM